MKKSMQISVLPVLVLSLLLTGSNALADNWPAWRGPDMNGISANGNPPVKWSETENVKWKVKLAGDTSDSSPIIFGDKLIFQEAVKTDKKADASASAAPAAGRRRFGGRKPTNIYKFNIVCLDRNTGSEIWSKTVAETLPHEGHHGDHGFASFSPITDGKHIWANFGSRGVHCLDMKGTVIWSKDLGKMQTRNSFGEGSSPVITGDKLIVVMDHEGDSFIAALNKNTGDIVWKKKRDELTS
ncbi:MAG: PQQ-binding-like beta-propeller repeat protein [Anaerohalosphaera sp.]|nr:PQQ-binding-like beta-propeller repeat protein [Anaerohalosphaera sp.]